MKFRELEIPGVFLIDAEPFVDARGAFRRNYCGREFGDHGLITAIGQCNVSENPYRHTLRGFHYQLPPHGEGKTLSCFRGAIHDVVVDLRPDSRTHMKWLAVELTEKNRRSVQVPPGCANAFLTLEENSLIFYYCSEPYHPSSERGIRYNDPAFRFQWPVEPAVISDKDRQHPDYKPERA